jgi:hypothetical protein
MIGEALRKFRASLTDFMLINEDDQTRLFGQISASSG